MPTTDRTPQRIDRPTEPGWYWWRLDEQFDWTAVKVSKMGRTRRALVADLATDWRRVSKMDGQWATCPQPW